MKGEILQAAGYALPELFQNIDLTTDQIEFGYKASIVADPGEVYALYQAELIAADILPEEGGVTQLSLELARLCASRDLLLWHGPVCIRWTQNDSVKLKSHPPGEQSADAIFRESWRKLISYRVGREVIEADDAWMPPALWRAGAPA